MSESAVQACRAAVSMLHIIDKINEKRILSGEPVFVTGIGVNTGDVSAGSVGSADRLHYTVVGDVVNTTSRLQDFTKSFGETGIVISQYTYDALGDNRDEFEIRSLGPRLFKGKATPIETYRLYPKA